MDLVKKQLPELPERNIIVEPEGRNTAPCINLSAQVIKRYYKNAKWLYFQRDHLIKYEGKFRKVLAKAEEFVDLNKKLFLH